MPNDEVDQGPPGTDWGELAWGPALTPYLLVDDARRALDWYVRVFEAERRGEPYVMTDGTIGHAELGIGDAVLMLADGAGSSRPARVLPAHSIFVTVPDADATVARAVTEGADLERPVTEEGYGRTGVINDPFGHRWLINAAPRRATRYRPGDVAYMTVYVTDAERSTAFYSSFLGPRLAAGMTSPPISVWPVGDDGSETPDSVPVYRVADIGAAVQLVRDGGGTADDPAIRPYGSLAGCTDLDGNPFALWQPPQT